MNDPKHSVLRRLVAPPPAQLAMTVPRAAETAILRAFQDQLGLPVRVEDVLERTATVAGWTGDMPDHALMLVLDGPGGRSGAAVLDAGLWAVVVETRLTGLLSASAPAARPVTAIDTALVEQVVNAVLAQFGTRLAGLAEAAWAVGFAVARPLEDPRLFQFALPEGELKALRINLTLGTGDRAGELRLLLPPMQTARAGDVAAAGDKSWAQGMKDGLLEVGIGLDAVLDRQRIPLATVAGWQPGDLVPVTGAALNTVRLQAAGETVLAVGRLGQSGGHRAVKLHQPVRAEGLVPRAQLPERPENAPDALPQEP